MSLIIHDEIRLITEIGVCKIQLCIGDITKLPKEESVDVLVVSAFPGDYSPTPTSLIGALLQNLQVSVRNLSKDKEEDLRKQYYCWWSKPLPKHLSFKRLLCFEGGFGTPRRKPPQVIGAVFRCLVPILNNEEGSVIMPFLSTGDQGYSKKVVLRQTVGSAVHWIKAGLPLRTLKIVLFARNPEKKDAAMQQLFDAFQDLKQSYAEEIEASEELNNPSAPLYDVYLSHSAEDHPIALQVVKFLKIENNLRVFHDVQELNDEESWQEDMFNIMVKCTRVVTLLGPEFLKSDSCIEQYNMALCLNRRCHRDVLAPLYITTVEILPTYMSLIQYIDCRPRNIDKMKEASNSIVKWVKGYNQQPQRSVEQSLSSTQKPSSYDVFISYCHANKTQALKVLDALKLCKPELNVFIDTAELQTGTSWQQTLYTALDSSKRMLALLSPDYAKSKVCREEFSLALALHMDKNSALELQSLLVLPLEKLPDWCSKPLPVDCTVTQEDDFDNKISPVCREFVRCLSDSTSTPNDALTDRMKTHKEMSTEEATAQFRKFCFVSRTKVLKPPVQYCSAKAPRECAEHGQKPVSATNCHQASEQEGPPAVMSESPECDLALSYAPQDSHVADILKQLLLQDMPHLKISEPQNNPARFAMLDKACLIAPLLSPAFVASKELMEELNIAIHRNRNASQQLLFPIHIAELPVKPSYIHLIPCEISVLDLSWAWKVMDAWTREEVERLVEKHDISSEVSFCLKSSCLTILQHLKEGASANIPNQVLLNITEVQKSWNEVVCHLEEQDGYVSLKTAFRIPTKVLTANNTDEIQEQPNTAGRGKGNSDQQTKQVRLMEPQSGVEEEKQEAFSEDDKLRPTRTAKVAPTRRESDDDDDQRPRQMGKAPRNHSCCTVI